MKKTTNMLKASLVGLFLTFTTTIFAQTAPPTPTTPITTPADFHVGTINDDETSVTPVTGAILFYNQGGTSIELVASTTDDVTNLAYTEYSWYRIGQDGSEISTETETGGTLTLPNLEPGFYRYRVKGWINDAGVTCQSDEYQDMIFFVLRPLAITSEAGTGAIEQFCLGDVPAGPLVLNETTTFDANVDYNTIGAFPNPDVGDFALTYRWYAVNDQIPGIEINIADPTNIDYNLFNALGTYTFYVEVTYVSTIKDSSTKPHAIWEAQVKLGTENYELTVTPKPGRPTISIGTIVD